MKALFPFILSFVTGEIARTIRNLKRKTILLGLIAFFGLIMVSFLLVAAELALSILFGPLYAALIIAGIALVICLVVLMILQITSARARRRTRERREATTPAYTAAAVSIVPSLLRSKKAALFAGIPIAALLGYLMVGRGGGSDEE